MTFFEVLNANLCLLVMPEEVVVVTLGRSAMRVLTRRSMLVVERHCWSSGEMDGELQK